MKRTKITALLLACLSILSCAEEKAAPKSVRPVKLHQVATLERFEKSFSAIVTPDEFSNLAFKMGGSILTMNVVDGQRVKKGDIVAEIDAKDFRLDYNAQNAAYVKAKSQALRAEKLLEKNAISQHEAESYEAAYIGAKSAFLNSKNMLNDTKLVAPFDGFIQKKFVETHQRVAPGEPILCLINPNALQIELTIPETNIKYLTNQREVFVEFDAYRGEIFSARIKEYVEASPDGAGVPVYVEICDERFDLNRYNISVGFSCRVTIAIENTTYKGAATIPVSAIVYDNKTNRKSVFCYNPKTSKVERKFFTDKGTIVGEEMLIVEGDIKHDDMIVSAGASYLTDGQEVKILAN